MSDPAGFRLQAGSGLREGDAFRFDWGEDGLRMLAPDSDVVVIVDILSFTTLVSTAIEAGATVVPVRHDDLIRHEEHLSEPRATLSAAELLCVAPGTRVVLPSSCGSALSCLARDLGVRHVLAGSFRNARATAAQAADHAGANGVISVIGAGERRAQGAPGFRPAVEDLLGAGAVLAALDPAAAVSGRRCSPEAAAARAAFIAARAHLYDTLARTATGRELSSPNGADDVAMASAVDVSSWAAELDGGVFVARLPKQAHS